MTLGIMDLGDQGIAILIPRNVVELLEWKEGDEIVGDIPMTGSELVLHRKDSKIKKGLTGPNNIIVPGAVEFPHGGN
jgi:hypothetical protein